MQHYSPLRYPGGKNCIFPFVSQFFYENNLVGINYAEPYAGGAGLALRLLFEEYVNKIFINDFDPSIYAFWHTVLNENERFCKWIEEVDISIENWKKYKNIQNKINETTSFELAKSTFFLNRTNISGVIKGGVIGGQNQSGKYKINARFNKKELILKLKKIYSLRDRIIISNEDGINFVDKLERKRKDIFIYLDPPYYRKGADLYMNFYREQDHRELSERVKKIRKKWMVSYDNHEFILDLYSTQKKLLYKLSQCASNRIGDEVLVFSDNLSYQNSMNALTSPITI
ncbi:MAG: DNA adenine methylase [Alistipes sp.]|nr:DNA adenine methylase [Alistipes sp.]